MYLNIKKKIKMCALGSAVGSLFQGPAWRAERGRYWLHMLLLLQCILWWGTSTFMLV